MDFILSHAVYCRDVLKLKKGQRAVISNGRVRILSWRQAPSLQIRLVNSLGSFLSLKLVNSLDLFLYFFQR